MRLTGVLLTALSLAAPAVPAFDAPAADWPKRETFVSGKATRKQYVFVPSSSSSGAPLPVLLALHGSGADGLLMAREWTELAERERFIVVAPDASDPMRWRLRQDGVEFIRDAIEAVGAKHPIDRKRIYLFGHSGGGVYALTLAMLESQYFAAAAIHAGGWRERGEYAALELAKRKIPIALFVGDRDEFFSVRAVEATASALKARGHPVKLTVLPRRRHAYRAVASRVNREAWEFLETRMLEAEPTLEIYR